MTVPSITPWPPVTFAWVQPTETTFGPQHIRMDEEVLDFEMTHSEGNFPELNVTIKNPYRPWVGAGIKYWVWMGYIRSGQIVPFFFGRMIATPDNIQDESVTIKFTARSRTWLKLKQHQADLLKDDPYDPILVNVNSRADPDTVLQFRSALWHFDRVPTLLHGATAPDLNVSISDILIPENGWLTFFEHDHFYKAFDWKIGQQPLQTVQVRTDVRWTQSGAGFVDIPAGNMSCWTGGSLVSGWPKPGSGLSGGYTVAYATAFSGTEFATATNHHFNWENSAQSHSNGDTMSEDVSWTTYTCSGDMLRYQVYQQVGVIAAPLPAAFQQGSDTSGFSFLPGFQAAVNIPLHIQWSELLVAFWYCYFTLGLEYDVQRPRHEKLQFNLNSNLQPVFIDIHEPASVDTEIITLPGADVGLPVINVQSWYTFFIQAGTVPAGTYVQSTPEAIGGPYFAVAVVGGHVGTFEPAWTLVLGQKITDGTVTWAMVGPTIPTDFPTWRDVAGAEVFAGTVIRSQFYLDSPRDIFGNPLIAPPAGTNAFQVATNTGVTQVYSNGLNGVADTSPAWPEPRFAISQGSFTGDGGVTWLSLGSGKGANPVLDFPLGINTGSRWFFPLDRGKRTIRAAINAGRAHLRMRARVIKLNFECAIERALDMDCRTGVLIYDHRLPGGSAYAKITSYTMTMNGDKSAAIAKVTAEAAPGYASLSLPSPGAGVPITVPGTGVYALSGYMQSGYQEMTGSTYGLAPPTSPRIPSGASNGIDVGYTPPRASDATDDGVVFPITDANQIIISQRWVTGRPPGAPQYVANAVFTVTALFTDLRGNTTEFVLLLPVPNGYTPVMVQQQYSGYVAPAAPVPVATPNSATSTIVTDGQGNVTTLPGGQQVNSSAGSGAQSAITVYGYGGFGQSSTATYLYYYPVTQYYLELQNLNKPFSNEYFVSTTPLQIEEMVNLSAASGP